ncbi:MAG: HAMP domain-containing histidine kinase [Clostridia bacterium]|nr:HAMP domain-containing histidine kinase [Clostridia bacterium]
MIKKLRIKITLITLALLCVLFYAMLAVFYFQTARTLKNESEDALRSYSRQNPSMIFDDRFNRFFGGTDEYSRYDIFIIEYREVGNLLTPYGFGRITEEQERYIFALMDEVLDRKEEIGELGGYGLRYMKTSSPGYTKVVFLDKSREDSTLSSMRMTLIAIAAAGTVCFLIIAIVVTRIALRPVERSWKQQRQLIADVSHELKTPVAVISANTDIVLSHPEDTVDGQMKWLGYIKDETARMNDLITGILYLAKSDETRASIEKTDFDLSNAVYAAALPFESVCFEKGLSLELNVEPDIRFFGSRDMMMRLVSILIDNACKYSESGGTVKTALYNAPEKTIIAVNNRGELITPEQAKHIFERFYRVDESRSEAGGSFGLGLSIASSITELHGGRIEVVSDEENGNTFICSFKRS